MSAFPSEAAGLEWFVVQAQPRKERFVRDRLSDLGRDAFLPLMAERRRGRRGVTVSPLFPGYLFARLSVAQGDVPRIRWMHGVRRLLGEGNRPLPVASEIVRVIRERTDATGRVRPAAPMGRGDRVRILEGPLRGLIGVLQRPASRPEERVCVLLDLFERETRVEVPAGTLGPMSGSA